MLLSYVQLFATPWTVVHQAPPSTGFSRQEYWSGLPRPPGDLPDPGIEPESPVPPALQLDSLRTEPLRKPLCLIREKGQSTTSQKLIQILPSSVVVQRSLWK